jgi:uncharacterized protein YjbJ (UPF0337 family)
VGSGERDAYGSAQEAEPSERLLPTATCDGHAWCFADPRRFCMNVNQLQGKWQQIKGKVREQWGKLSRDDLEKMEGREDQIVGKLQELYGLEKEAAKREFEIWLSSQPDEPMKH